jgi:membrane-bound serine protease (ClpP class)
MAAAILLVVASLAVFILEVFVLSFGILSVIGIALAVSGVIVAFGESNVFGWSMIGVLLVGLPVCVTTAFKLLPKLPFARGFYLRAPKLTAKERHAAAAPSTDLMGQTGEATSPLRPAGSAVFGDEPIQVVSTGELIPRGARVKVVEVTGNRVVVEEVSGSS